MEALHRLRERHTFRRSEDEEAAWRCCPYWRRTLIYKWNGREFARKHGCRVPELYWFGRKLGRAPFESLPEHYVVKPNLGSLRKGVHVMAAGRDLLSGAALTREQLVRRVGDATRGGFGVRFLIEEFVTSESGQHQLPTEYKCHVFGERVGAIQVIQRAVPDPDTRVRFYSPQWEAFDDPMTTIYPLANPIDPPRCLDDILSTAKRLGQAFGTYVRVDLYASEGGCVFGELSSTPAVRKGFTRYADEYLGALWQESFPESV